MKKKTIYLGIVFLIIGCGGNPKTVDLNSKPHRLLQLTGGAVSFRGLCAVNDNVAWASGSGGTFAKTTDGGKNWQVSKIKGAEKIDFRDIEAFDKNTAVVFGIDSPAKFYKTTDGGKNWRLVYSNDTPGVFFSSAAFWDSKNGIALSDPITDTFYNVLTFDGGDTWINTYFQNFPQAVKDEGIFAASGSNIALPEINKIIFVTGCTAARVFISPDQGTTWSDVNSPFESGKGSNGIFSIAMKDDQQGIIVGGDYNTPDGTITNAAVTNDGGKTWKLVENNKPSGFRECVKYKPGTNIAITVGPNGSDISYDGGLAWTNFSKEGFHVVAFSPDGKSCWAAGRNGKIAKLIPPY